LTSSGLSYSSSFSVWAWSKETEAKIQTEF